ncbi:unnamed protein product [Brassicogethes aeneus]|uniref:Partial AB-hydrolase lipase domain-containing protein n=1 Tax=Brassicogethes aeneus TaxID=1431903 RepID=A0A9P0B525_BRAAE|nr:unnamed protein product [Brassicogethes aeneus]
MIIKTTTIYLFLLLINNSLGEDFDVHGSIDEIADYYGYQTQNFTVQTDDGFNLIIFRIMCKDNCTTSSTPKQPLVIWHGFLLNARFYVLNGKNSIAFHYVDKGYDVYLANTRGTIYSNHISLSPTSAKYWDFGFGALAKNEIRKVTNKICQMTNQKLITMAYATSTNAVVAYAALFPEEVAQNHKGFILYGVTVNIFQTRSIHFPILGVIADPFRDATYLLEIKYLDTSFTQNCQYEPYFPACNAYINTVLGESDHIDVKLSFPKFFGEGTEPIPTSLIVNLAQIIQHKGVFQDLDYGVLGNLHHYNQINAQVFDLNAIRDIRIDILCTNDNEFTCADAKSTYDYLSVNKTFTYLPKNEKCPGNLIHFNYFMCDDMYNCITGPFDEILQKYY